MNGKYHSFLICSHPEKQLTNLFIDGLPIGQINAVGEFIQDELFEHRNPFKNHDILVEYLVATVNLIKIPTPQKQKDV